MVEFVGKLSGHFDKRLSRVKYKSLKSLQMDKCQLEVLQVFIRLMYSPAGVSGTSLD